MEKIRREEKGFERMLHEDKEYKFVNQKRVGKSLYTCYRHAKRLEIKEIEIEGETFVAHLRKKDEQVESETIVDVDGVGIVVKNLRKYWAELCKLDAELKAKEIRR